MWDDDKDHARIREANSMCLASVFRSFVDVAQEMMRSIWLNSSLDACPSSGFFGELGRFRSGGSGSVSV
jgi:hypothetical protein